MYTRSYALGELMMHDSCVTTQPHAASAAAAAAAAPLLLLPLE
jgi:hypothetical protein